MYTRSFPSRRMPPDYGGTALVVKNNDDNLIDTKTNDSSQTDMRPRRTLISKQAPPLAPPMTAPFGIHGQEYAKESSLPDVPEKQMIEVSATEPIQKQSIFDPENLKSDDLLLLGIALMLLYDKDANGNIPLDALLILAMIYLSGL